MIDFVIGAICTLVSVICGAGLALTSKSFSKEEAPKRNVKG